MTVPNNPFDLARVGAGLPVSAHVDQIASAADTGSAIVEAPPGTGKTTVIPPLLANLAAREDRAGRVVVTQPRRVAARSAASRLATLTGTRVGDLVGHVVHQDVRMSARTKVEFCTTGVLVRRLLADPELPGIDTVILDEVHERHIDDDLALGMLAELRELRPELRVLAMSATLDSALFAAVLGEAPVVRVDSALHPLQVRWAPPSMVPFTERGVSNDFLDHVARTTAEALSEPGDSGDVRDSGEGSASALVFVPGAREVDRVCAQLRARVDLPVLPLHGRLDAASQDAAIHGPGPRVVVATNLAESSVTVAGVHLVVDSGLSREPRYDSVRGITGLVTVPVARAAAIQRAGRAARLGPGTVVRCFAEERWARLPAESAPEIRTADLTRAALDLAVWGTPGGRGLSLPESPPPTALARAEDTLRALGAVDEDGAVTPHGRRLSSFATEPRLAHALLAAVADGMAPRAAAEVVAMLTEQGPLPSDLESELGRLRRERPHNWQALVRQLVRQIDRRPHGGAQSAGEPRSSPAAQAGPPGESLAQVIAFAWPDRIARLRNDGTGYLLSGGTGADVPRGWEAPPSWLAVADLDHGPTGARIRSAVPMSEALALHAGANLLDTTNEAWFAGGRARGRQVRRLGAIELTSTPVRPSMDEAMTAVAGAIAEQGLTAIAWGDRAESLRRRVAFVHHHLGEPWPAMGLAELADTAADWLGPELAEIANGLPANRVDIAAALRRSLPWPAAGQLDHLAPERLEVPTGSRIRVDYPEDPAQPPVVAVKLQECFGLASTPMLCDGRVPVVFHLLSPAQRPLAITDDLASFWSGAYAQVRAENRARYSKHPWPEDPLAAAPQRGTKRRKA